MNVNGIHHLTFAVRSVQQASAAWSKLLATEPVFEELSARQARSARFRVGTTWVVFVEPTDPDSEIAKHLAARGEGLLLVSLDVPALDEALGEPPISGISNQGPPRHGLQQWRVQDLALDGFSAAIVQLCEDQGAPKAI
jgi:methylmalonyl-CoA/ethylmalonyl-CoA epimerase